MRDPFDDYRPGDNDPAIPRAFVPAPRPPSDPHHPRSRPGESPPMDTATAPPTAPTRPRWDRCRVTHPFTRAQCIAGTVSHELHWTHAPGEWWNTFTGQTTSPLGVVTVAYYARFIPRPGHPADEEVEHFPDPIILRHQVAQRTTYRYGTSFAPSAGQGTVRYAQVAPGAYAEVWVLLDSDPPPHPRTTAPTERWHLDPGYDVVTRTPLLPVVPR